jgi:hypothetical protein
VIGRSDGWPADKLKALHGLNSRLSGISIMTYDQLFVQEERIVEVLSSDKSGAGEDSFDFPKIDDDDLPF